MPRKFFRRYVPDHNKLRQHPRLNQLFGALLHDPNLLHLNRRSVSGAFFIGLFMAFVPMPFQMLPAAALAIYWRTNLPLSLGLVWVSNPVTIPPIFYFCYKLGAWILDRPVQRVDFVMDWAWFGHELTLIWQPFLLGCFVVATLASLLGGFGIRLLWRWHVVRQWEERKQRRATLKTKL
ncbi:MAG: DUF2062 domain-containing protein [Gammaproteobacteria bacterium]